MTGGISNIEQGILNDEVEIAAVASLLRNDRPARFFLYACCLTAEVLAMRIRNRSFDCAQDDRGWWAVLRMTCPL